MGDADNNATGNSGSTPPGLRRRPVKVRPADPTERLRAQSTAREKLGDVGGAELVAGQPGEAAPGAPGGASYDGELLGASYAQLEPPRAVDEVKRDVASVVRTALLGIALLKAKKNPARAYRADRTEALAEKIASGVAPRIGPKLDKVLFWVAMAADTASEFIEDAIADARRPGSQIVQAQQAQP